LSSGPSSVIARAVIEVFAPEFLQDPAVVWLSESSRKVVQRDDQIARRIGLSIDASSVLPDIVLADLGPRRPRLVFAEVVATDGAMTERRVTQLNALLQDSPFRRDEVAFVTAYLDRSAAAFRTTIGNLAIGSFAWFVTEPSVLLRYVSTPSASQRRRLLFPR
jgi:hypothetical protein